MLIVKGRFVRVMLCTSGRERPAQNQRLYQQFEVDDALMVIFPRLPGIPADPGGERTTRSASAECNPP
jgi:hypothetical protein